MSADVVSINRKKANEFLKEMHPERFIIITADDPIGIIKIGEMSKAELMGTLEIAKLLIADEV
jgi:hypothetical protein